MPRAFELSRLHPNLFLCVGVHPSEAGRVPESYLDELRDHARHARVVAIGETGLDFYRDHAPREAQERWFRAQLRLADQLGLPVVIHQRSALEPVLSILEETRPAAGGVLHCFDDDVRAAERGAGARLQARPGWLSHLRARSARSGGRLGGRESTDARDRCALPRAGAAIARRNEPALLPRVAKRLAELRGWSLEETDRITTANARELFRLPIG